MNSIKRRFGVLCVLAFGAVGLAAVELDDAAIEQARLAFIERMVAEHGYEPEAVAGLLSEAQIDTGILEIMTRPAERVMPWHEYRNIFLRDERIAAGARFWREHAGTIEQVAGRYEVDPEMLVAIIGIETFFGERTGRYRVLDALATLAFAYPPRATFFASELEQFLLLAEEERVDVLGTLGSYAGAMGAGQFIPSSYRAYAVDADGDGRRDLWASWHDILGSVANYFMVHGWRQGETIADQATLSSGWDGHEPGNSLDLTESVASAARLGYVFPTEHPESAPVSILRLEGEAEPEYWVGYHNFHVITRYNRSVKYAMAAYQLGEAIRAEFSRDDGER